MPNATSRPGPGQRGGMMSGFEITSSVLTLCQNQSVQSVTPFCTTHLNQFCTECCLEVIVLPWLSNVSWQMRFLGQRGRGGAKGQCGPATLLQPHLPAHGLHCRISGRLAFTWQCVQQSLSIPPWLGSEHSLRSQGRVGALRVYVFS